ncbi:MAG: DNA polymerase III subunit chi [Pseudomonadota bacterium]
MADIRFYHLQSKTLDQALPDLLVKALAGGKRIVIRTPNHAETQRLSAHLWVCRRDDILPHGTKDDGLAQYQPIWITDQNENPNRADMLVVTQGVAAPTDGFSLICDMFDGQVDAEVTGARTRFKSARDAGHTVTYWQQKPTGGWEQKG